MMPPAPESVTPFASEPVTPPTTVRRGAAQAERDRHSGLCADRGADEETG